MKQCNIETCEKEHYAKGLCSNHWHQYKNGTIDQNGVMKLKIKQCKACGEILIFDASSKNNNVKWCKDCRANEYLKIQKEINRRFYEKNRKKRYLITCLNKVIKELNFRKKYYDIIKMRKQGKTFIEIGNNFNISKQRAHQIWLKYQELEKKC